MTYDYFLCLKLENTDPKDDFTLIDEIKNGELFGVNVEFFQEIVEIILVFKVKRENYDELVRKLNENKVKWSHVTLPIHKLVER